MWFSLKYWDCGPNCLIGWGLPVCSKGKVYLHKYSLRSDWRLTLNNSIPYLAQIHKKLVLAKHITSNWNKVLNANSWLYIFPMTMKIDIPWNNCSVPLTWISPVFWKLQSINQRLMKWGKGGGTTIVFTGLSPWASAKFYQHREGLKFLNCIHSQSYLSCNGTCTVL